MTEWREILIVTGGSTPQVVTETIFALWQRKADPIIPSKIICVITKGVADGFGSQFHDALHRLQTQLGISTDWSVRSTSWHAGRSGLYIEHPFYANGTPVSDIRTDTDAVLFGDLVADIVRTETLDDNSRVHLSLAGGRKTMSFHGGAAMSIFGRPQDELSHVLVHPPDFEGCRNYWFPTINSEKLIHKDGRTLDARNAEVELALVPFVRVRDRLSDRLVSGRLNYAAHVAQTNAILGRIPLFLELLTSERRVRIGDLADFTLPNTVFSLYQLMAEWRLNSYKGAGPTGIGHEYHGWLTAHMFEHPEKYRPNPVQRFLEIYSETFRSGTGRSDEINRIIIPLPIDTSQRKGNEANFSQWKARLLSELQGHLHQSDLADRFGAPRNPTKVRFEMDGKRGNRVVFGLKLQPREIVIRSN